MKPYTLAMLALLSMGCNTMKHLVNGSSPQQGPAVAPSTAQGTVTTLDTWIAVDLGNNQALVRVKRNGEDWVVLNKYEFTYDQSKGVLLKHKVTITPQGQLTFKVPYEPVAPIGTVYSITALDTEHSLY